jgi:hypothetical protein
VPTSVAHQLALLEAHALHPTLCERHQLTKTRHGGQVADGTLARQRHGEFSELADWVWFGAVLDR